MNGNDLGERCCSYKWKHIFEKVGGKKKKKTLTKTKSVEVGTRNVIQETNIVLRKVI